MKQTDRDTQTVVIDVFECVQVFMDGTEHSTSANRPKEIQIIVIHKVKYGVALIFSGCARTRHISCMRQ